MDTTSQQLQARLAQVEAMAAHVKQTSRTLQGGCDEAEGNLLAEVNRLANQIRRQGVGSDRDAEERYCHLQTLRYRLMQTHALAGQDHDRLADVGDLPAKKLEKGRRSTFSPHPAQSLLDFDAEAHPRLPAGGTLPGYKPGQFVPKPGENASEEPEDRQGTTGSEVRPDHVQVRTYGPDQVEIPNPEEFSPDDVLAYAEQYRENPDDPSPVTLAGRHDGGGYHVLSGGDRVLGAYQIGSTFRGIEIPDGVHVALRGMGYTDSEISVAMLSAAREYDAADELIVQSDEPSLERRASDAERHLTKLMATAHPPPEQTPATVREKLDEIHGLEETVDAGADYAERGTKAISFKTWFGDWEHDPANASKVVNPKTGEPQEEYNTTPLPVFHGTKAGGFRSFNPLDISDYNIFGPGFYFTADRGIAEEYTQKDADDASALAGATVGFRDAKTGEIVTTLDAKRAEKYINTPEGQPFEDRAMLNNPNWHPYVKAALETAMGPEGVSVQRFLDALGEEQDIKRFDTYAKFKPSRMRGNARGWGIAAFMKEWGNLKPIIPDPEVKEVYLNIRKPFDMDEPVTQEEMNSFMDFISERMAKATGNARYHYFNDDLLRHEDADKAFPDGMPLEPTIADFVKIKEIASAYRRNEQDTNGKWKPTDQPLHGIFDLSPDVLTKGDFHYIISDGHHTTGERRIFTEWVKSRGHDGIAHTGGFNIGSHNHQVWIAFDPEQIKATANEGTFDPTTPDMYKGLRAEWVPPDVPKWRSERPSADTYLPLNGVEVKSKFREMVDRMERGTWEQTVPLIRVGDQLITGSHRYAAHRETETPFETKTLDSLFREHGLDLKKEWTARAQPFNGWISNLDFALAALPPDVKEQYGIDLG